jgi:hypothetical protein
VKKTSVNWIRGGAVTAVVGAEMSSGASSVSPRSCSRSNGFAARERWNAGCEARQRLPDVERREHVCGQRLGGQPLQRRQHEQQDAQHSREDDLCPGVGGRVQTSKAIPACRCSEALTIATRMALDAPPSSAVPATIRTSRRDVRNRYGMTLCKSTCDEHTEQE